MYLNLRPEGRVRTCSVILPISQDHTSVKSCVSGSSGRNDFKFGGLKVPLADSVIIGKNFENRFFDSFFFASLIFFFSFCAESERPAAYDQIQGFAFHHCGCRLFELILGKVDQQIRDKEYRIVLILADTEDHCLSVLFDDHTVDRKGNSHILVFLDPSVIVCIEKRDLIVLIHGILLDVQAG